MNQEPVQQTADQILANIKALWLSGVAGLSIIVTGFVISVVNASLDTPETFVSITLQPFIFVGLGLLLYHIGQHVHAMNQNAILMANRMGNPTPETQHPK